MNQQTIKAILYACTLLATQSALAEIVYSGPDRDLVLDRSHPTLTLDMAGESMLWDDLALGLNIRNPSKNEFHAEAFTLPHGQGKHVMTAASNGYVEKLPEDYAINASLNYTISKGRFFSYHYSCKMETVRGNFPDQTGYIALQLCNQDKTYYGWARVSGERRNPGDFRLTVHDWAYNNVAGEGILAGHTHVPEPSSATMALACSTGLLFFRRIFLI